jgi:uncharacterized protein YkwD
MKIICRVLAMLLSLSAAGRGADDGFFQQTLGQINLQRQKAGVGPVALDDKLMKIAGEWAVKKARVDDLVHRRDFTPLLAALNYSFMNENIYFAENSAKSAPPPAQVVAGWMNSSGHRKNLLNGRIDKIGLGLAQTAGGGYYVVFNGADSRPPKTDEPDADQGGGVRLNGIRIR